MWSMPLKKTTGETEYNLLLLDTEGIDAYDQTGTYSIQIFSLAVLLSSLFVYNQMGGIDEAALDQLSLVTELTKHIRLRASEHRSTYAELGQHSPVFLWLLRDFYLDLSEEGERVSPRDYLESALQPIAGEGRAIAARNEIRDSIRALFPDRHCFTLVRPLNNEHDLQHLDQFPFDSLRPEFQAGMDALTKFVFDRTKPKQLGSNIMTGPMFVSLTQSFLDAINAGAVPTLANSWQNVEESECRRAYDVALELYIKAFTKSSAVDEEALRMIHETAVTDAFYIFDNEAVGSGAARQKYEKMLSSAFKKHYEESMHKIWTEAELKCTRMVEMMDEKLWAVCQSSDVSLGQVFEALNTFLEDYDDATSGPSKWKKFRTFLQNSLKGSLLGVVKRMNLQSQTDSVSFQMKHQSLEDRLINAEKQLECAKREMNDWRNRYELLTEEAKSSEEASAARYLALEKMYDSLNEKCSLASHQLEISRKEVSDWRASYEVVVTERKTLEEQLNVEIGVLRSRCSSAEGRLAASQEQLQSAKEEVHEWRRKYDLALEELHITSERAAAICERLNRQAQDRQDALLNEYFSNIARKERETNDVKSKVEGDERHIAALQDRLEDQELKICSQEEEMSRLRLELRQIHNIVDIEKAKAISMDKELSILKQQKHYLEDKLNLELKRSEDAVAKQQQSEKEMKLAVGRLEKVHEEIESATKARLEAERLAAERLAAQISAERRNEVLVRENDELSRAIHTLQDLERDTISRMRSMDRHLEVRDKEMGELLDSAHKQRADTLNVLESLLDTERQACAEANARAEALSVQLQSVQGKLDSLQQKFSIARLNETLLDGRLRICHCHGELGGKSPSSGKRARLDDSVLEDSANYVLMNASCQMTARKPDKLSLVSRCSPTQSQCDTPDKLDNRASPSDSKESDDYMRFTIPRLRQELSKAGILDELEQMKSPTKKEIIELYERHVLHKFCTA
ncbi:hypothetical protein KP509_03G061100 [Ceratopteris richardii]|nr:hypothetical protein KP509_03G061100 [Ceratopteris richardii]